MITEPVSTHFFCPHCQQKMSIPPRLTAVDVPCPTCRRTIRAPASGIYPGLVIDSMRIERRLGRGSMGEVYLATHQTLNRRVAFKVLSPAFTGNRDAVERFMREVRHLAKLTHPNLVTAYTAGSSGDIHYLAMAYVAGETMHSRIQRKGPLGEEDALSVALCVARALRHAWERHHILHRDVKPANIMVDDDGEIKLTDLGLSKSLLEEGEATQSGLLIGTPHYMSPEQAQGIPVTDVRTDIYGLGATLYHLLCGGPPFPAETVREILSGHRSAPPPSVLAKQPALSAATDRLVRWMMAKDAAKRPADWTVVERELETILQKNFPLSGPATGPTRLKMDPPPAPAAPAASPLPPAKSNWLGGFLLLGGLAAGGAMMLLGHLNSTQPEPLKPAPANPSPTITNAPPAAPTNTVPPARPKDGRAHLPPPVRDVMIKLDRAAAPHIKARRWREAAAVYTSYSGPYAKESERPRRNTAERLLRSAK